MMDEVKNYLRQEGYAVDDDYRGRIDEWYQWYKNDVDNFYKYYVYNGQRKVMVDRASLGLPKQSCEDWADLLLNEKVTITTKQQDLLDDVLAENDFWANGNDLIEKAFALGTGALVAYKAKDKVKIDYIIASMIFPLRVANRRIVDCAFASEISKGTYYIQTHLQQPNGSYKVTNKILRKSDEPGKGLIDGALPKNLKSTYTSPVKLFWIIQPNQTNNIDLHQAMGMSIYANAFDQIKDCDIKYDSYQNEFKLGKKRIFVKAGGATHNVDKDGNITPVFDTNDTTFYAMPGDAEADGKMIEESNFELRVQEHDQALQTALNLFGQKVGFGTDYYSFSKGEVYTNTTQVMSTNSKLFRRLKKHEILLESALIGLVRAVISLATGSTYQEDVTINFDDSIIEDTAETMRQAMLELNAGLIDAVEYHMRVYKLTEEEAQKKVNKMQARMPKEQEEPPEE